MKHQENGYDRASLQAIFEQFETPLVRYACRLVGNTERGRDVVQDVFLKLCRQSPQPTDDRMAAWLYTVCRNRALDVCKKEQRMSSLHSVSTNGDLKMCDLTGPQAAAAGQAENNQVHTCTAAADRLTGQVG